MKRIFNRWFFASLIFFASVSHALLPVWVGAVAYDTLVATASSVSIGVLARGFAANDPYVKTVATIPRATLASNMSRYLKGPRWLGLAALAALIMYPYDEDIGFYDEKTDWPQTGYCQMFGDMSLVECGKATYKANWACMEYHGCAIDPVSEYEVEYLGVRYLPNQCVGVSPPCHAYAIRNSGIFGSYFYTHDESKSQKIPLSEQQYNSALDRIAASPKPLGELFAGADPVMLNKLLDGATIPYEATKPTPQLAELMSQYRQGLLQSSDPNKPYYVDPDLMAKIQNLVAKEDALNTDQGKLDALNKSIEQPITQAQYEASNLKSVTEQAGAFATAIGTATTPLDKVQQERQDIIDNISNPAAPPSSLDFFNWSIPTGHCTGFNVEMSVDGGRLHQTKLVDSHCPFYNDIGHPAIFWFLNIVTFLFVWRLWDQSISDMAR